ncbi:Hypothetical protein EIN_189900, partial [Entamoeba invadens IP1]
MKINFCLLIVIVLSDTCSFPESFPALYTFDKVCSFENELEIKGSVVFEMVNNSSFRPNQKTTVKESAQFIMKSNSFIEAMWDFKVDNGGYLKLESNSKIYSDRMLFLGTNSRIHLYNNSEIYMGGYFYIYWSGSVELFDNSVMRDVGYIYAFGDSSIILNGNSQFKTKALCNLQSIQVKVNDNSCFYTPTFSLYNNGILVVNSTFKKNSFEVVDFSMDVASGQIIGISYIKVSSKTNLKNVIFE